MRRKRRKETGVSEGVPEWMLTYSDMVTLLLVFFIMLFSMATIDNKKFMEIARSLRSSFIRDSGGEMYDYNSGKDLISISEVNNDYSEESLENNDKKDLRQKKLEDVIKMVQAAIERLGLGEYITVIDQQHSIILRFDSVVLFDLGKAEILPPGKDVLIKIGSILKELDNEINIEGHTDNLPINTLLFPTNWELSTKRATNVVLILVDDCGLNPTKLAASGRGEFKPIKPNNSDENRSKNRRIDIIIEK
jgi:chemotaxis protein MotB